MCWLKSISLQSICAMCMYVLCVCEFRIATWTIFASQMVYKFNGTHVCMSEYIFSLFVYANIICVHEFKCNFISMTQKIKKKKKTYEKYASVTLYHNNLLLILSKNPVFTTSNCNVCVCVCVCREKNTIDITYSLDHCPTIYRKLIWKPILRKCFSVNKHWIVIIVIIALKSFAIDFIHIPEGKFYWIAH